MEEVYRMGIEVSDETYNPALKLHPFPSWTYLFRPFSENGNMVGIGRCYVKLITAENLMTSSPNEDVYLVLQVGQDVLTSKTVKAGQPNWDQEMILSVMDATQELVIEMWQQENKAKPATHIAVRSIPLHEFSHQKRFAWWVDLDLTPDGDRLRFQRQEVKKPEDKTPRVRLELQFTFSKAGEFLSYLEAGGQQSTADTLPEEFAIDRFYYNCYRVYYAIMPIWDCCAATARLIRQPLYIVRLIALLIFIFVGFYPWGQWVFHKLFSAKTTKTTKKIKIKKLID